MHTLNAFPAPRSLDLWHINLSDYFAVYDEYFVLLNTDEQIRAEKFKLDLHRRRFVIARGYLRKILQYYTKISARDIALTSHPQQKPFLKENPHNIEFNLSHSEDKMLCAVTKNNSVGVDIEKIRGDIDFRIADRFFTAQENHILSSCSEEQKKDIFFRLWVGKEAIVKMTGKGLWTALNTLSIDPAQLTQQIIFDDTVCHLQFVAIDSSYASAIATMNKIENINIMVGSFI